MNEKEFDYKNYIKEKTIVLEKDIMNLLKELHSFDISINSYISMAETKFFEGDERGLGERCEFLERFKKALNVEITKHKSLIIVSGLKKEFFKRKLNNELLVASKQALVLCVQKMNMLEEIDDDGLKVCDDLIKYCYKIMKLCISLGVDISDLFELIVSTERMKKLLQSNILLDIEKLNAGFIDDVYLYALNDKVFEIKVMNDNLYPYANLDVIRIIVDVSLNKNVKEIIVNSLLIDSKALSHYNLELSDLLSNASNKYYLLDKSERSQSEVRGKYKKDLRDRCEKLRGELDVLRDKVNTYYDEYNSASLKELSDLLYLIDSLNYDVLSDNLSESISRVNMKLDATRALARTVKII